MRRSIGEPVNVRDLAVPPLVLLALGVRELARRDALTVGRFYGLVKVARTDDRTRARMPAPAAEIRQHSPRTQMLTATYKTPMGLL